MVAKKPGILKKVGNWQLKQYEPGIWNKNN